MDVAYRNAQARQKALLEKLEELKQALSVVESELAHVKQFMADWSAFAGLHSQDSAAESASATNEEKSASGKSLRKRVHSRYKPVRPKNPDRPSVVAHVESILKEEGGPLNLKELFIRLRRRGIELHGSNPEMVLSTMLWRSRDQLTRIQGRGYWFANAEIGDKSTSKSPSTDLDYLMLGQPDQ